MRSTIIVQLFST